MSDEVLRRINEDDVEAAMLGTDAEPDTVRRVVARMCNHEETVQANSPRSVSIIYDYIPVHAATVVTLEETARLRAEAKLRERALLAAKYDAERVRYYQEALCIDDRKWTCLPETGAGTATINPEKLKDVLAEREHLHAEVARLNKRLNLIEPVLAEALAVLRLPDIDNDGGPGNLAEDIRNLLHNTNAALNEAVDLQAEVGRLEKLHELDSKDMDAVIHFLRDNGFVYSPSAPGIKYRLNGMLITDEQIDAAWRNATDGGACLEDLGIVECPECGGSGLIDNWHGIKKHGKRTCPRCHGHKWIGEERDDE